MVKKHDTKRTKVVCTIGPASSNEETLRAMIRAGMDVARINFSHGAHEDHGKNIALIRRLAKEEDAVVAILGDLQGPKIRIGKVSKEPVTLKSGDKLTLTTGNADGANMLFPLPHPEFVRDVKVSDRLLLDDGNLEFKVTGKQGGDLACEVIIGGPLSSNKGISAPGSKLTLSAITDKDREDVKFALEQQVDYLAMSFVRREEDINQLRWLCDFLGNKDVAIIAKIEMQEALANIDQVIEAADGIMVARGDLGVETPAEAVPIHQKDIIRRCNLVGKPVITATQMLESMIRNPRPTRAEASDVANAIFDGSDAIMLSGETAAGKFPIHAVEFMARCARNAEQHFRDDSRQNFGHLPLRYGKSYELVSDAISRAASEIAVEVNAKMIVAATWTGYTARQVARDRPLTPILCVTPNEVTARRMALVWDVYPMVVPEFKNINEMLEKLVSAAYDAGLVERDDMLVIIGGVPFGVGGFSNFLKVHKVGDLSEIPPATMPAVTVNASDS